MKKLLLSLLAVALLTACNKNNSDLDPVLPAIGSRIKTHTSGATISSYTYDGQGRITLSTRSDGSKSEYEYVPGLVTEKIYNAAGIFQYSYKYELNASGSTHRTTKTDNPNYESLDLYNADGTMAKSISIINGNSSFIDFFYSNGNCDSARFSGNNGWFLTIVKTYETSKPNVLSDTEYGYTFYGKNNKNMLKTEQYTYPDGSSLSLANFSYEYDAQGRVTKQTATKGNNISISLFSWY